tara:strand:+ start:1798 stop:2766 length:969 start_codon:yes stop_codon:yes gene_type:complete
MINILVSGPGGDVAQGVIKSLQKSDLNFRIYKIAASMKDSWLYLDDFSFLSPRADDEEYIDFICDFITEHKIDSFIPCIDSEIIKISKNKSYIQQKTNVDIAIGDLEQIKTCHDKLKTAQFLEQNGFCFPKTRMIDSGFSDIGFPLILKSKSGNGSKNVYEINSLEDLAAAKYDDNFIVQEKIEGDEYTAGCYLGNDLEIKGICILKRELRAGSTYYAERIIDPEMEKYLGKIAKKLGLKYVNIQFRLKNGIPCPFEFNGRFSGTTGIISNVFNAPEMYIKEALLNQDLEKTDNNKIFYVMRYYEEIYASQEDIRNLLERSK